MQHASHRPALLAASALVFGGLASPALAQGSGDRLGSIERQIQSLQAELRRVKHDMAARDSEVRAAAAQAARAQAQADRASLSATAAMPEIPAGYALVPAGPGKTPGSVVLTRTKMDEGPALLPGSFRVGDVTVTLGGFIDVTAIARSRNETTDISSNFNTGIPLRNSPNYHQGEFRGTARQTRVSATVVARPDPTTRVEAYVEADFQGAAPTANSVESNSYNPRFRQAYLVYDRSDLGLEILGGQAWSLLTMDKVGIIAHQENIPVQIDSGYEPGFTWTRQPQLRVVKSFADKTFWLAGSIESPQANFYTGPNGLAPTSVGTININNPGAGTFASTTNYSNDVAPDVILKAAADLGPAHLEAYALGRVLHDRVSHTGTGSSDTTFAGGGGAAALVHVIPKMLDIQGSFLIGDGIGRYGSAQLPDAVVGPNGSPVALPELEALVGVIAHPAPVLDLYAYAGTEQIKRKYFASAGKGYGYGSPLYPNTSCDTELGLAADCVGNTSGIVQGTGGFWYKFMHSSYGTLQTGVQYSYTHRTIFQGVGRTPETNENIVMLSFRYYPFQ